MIHELVRPSRQSLRRRVAATSVLTLAAGVALAAGAAPAFAGTATNATTLSGSTTLGHASASGDFGPLHAQADADVSMDWSQVAAVSVNWDDNLVRQGRSLDPKVGYARTVPGSMSVTYSVSASLSWDGLSATVSTGITASGPCDLKAGGPDYTCHLTSPDVGVVDPSNFAVGFPYVDMAVIADVTVSPNGIDTLRTASFDGTPAGTANLNLQESPITDSLAVPCSSGVGDTLGYHLGGLSATDGVTVATGLDFKVGVIAPNPITVTPGFRVEFTHQVVPIDSTSSTIAMAGAGSDSSLGAVQANNIAPSISVSPSFSGNEGSPITFGASATGPCAASGTYKWTFSDGTAEYGATVHHAFTDSGPYTGHVKITDTTGLSDTADFSVDVANLAPAVHVVPSAPTVAWGRPLTLQAQAVDPGAGDQSTLTYAWNFDDGTPIVTGGPSETHEWATPGSYGVTVEVCDDDGGCTTSPVPVTVRKRSATIGYTGDSAGTYSASTNLSGSLVDEYGQPVNGATLGFALDGGSVGSAVTGSAGTASKTVTVGLSAGGHSVTASFGGTSRYTPADPASTDYAVAVMGTSLTYTGSVLGAPNKAVPLSAKLTDSLGRPLAGRTITFVLGSQSATAVTGATGVAATSLVLNQKPNRYPLTVSWTGEAGKYAPSSQALSFSLNKK